MKTEKQFEEFMKEAFWVVRYFLRKALLFFFLFSFASASNAQVKQYLGNSASVVALQDSIETTLSDFKYTGVDSGGDLRGKVYSLSLANTTGKTIFIQYRKDDTADVSIYGPYDELYLLWKKYFNARADKDRVALTGDRIRNEGSFNFVKQNDSWRIFKQ